VCGEGGDIMSKQTGIPKVSRIINKQQLKYMVIVRIYVYFRRL
jgi:hypothetical protein